jgi:hypothetical protein
MSASPVKGPSLPSAANGFASGLSIQKDRVGFGTGKEEGLSDAASNAFWLASSCSSGMAAETDMVDVKLRVLSEGSTINQELR